MSFAWTLSVLVLAIQANDYFIQWSYRFGVVVSMTLAFLSGWLYFWVGYRLVAPENQKGAASGIVLVIDPLLALMGVVGVLELGSDQNDPSYYDRNGVGPVNMVAFLAQSGGMLVGWKVYWSGLQRAQRAASRQEELGS